MQIHFRKSVENRRVVDSEGGVSRSNTIKEANELCHLPSRWNILLNPRPNLKSISVNQALWPFSSYIKQYKPSLFMIHGNI